MANVAILGSTGSIGRMTLEVLASLGEPYRAVSLAAETQTDRLAAQVAATGVSRVSVGSEKAARSLREALPRASEVEILVGPAGLEALASDPEADIVLSAVVGGAGLPAALAAVRAGKRLALANKESLVMAGALVMGAAAESGAEVVPVDSEHSAIFQAMRAGRKEEVARIYLTASGGPFRTWSAEQIAGATLQDALNHPTWNMGPKITIDSATMMNKALEVIEARWLFDVPADRITVVVHPESIIHSMVEFCDGSIVAQLGTPDMRTPIQYALTYPHRRPGPSERLDVLSLRRMHFEPPDTTRFPAVDLGFQAARRGGTSGAILNAANEAAVEAFRQDRIRFSDVVKLTSEALAEHEDIAEPTLEDLFEADAWARSFVAAKVDQRSSARA